MRVLLTNLFLLRASVILLLLITGCSGGGISLIVSDIQGPTTVNELEDGEYSVEVSGGTNITYQWHCNPADAGEFYPSDHFKTKFTADEASADTPVEIWVIINSDNEGPIIKKFKLVVKAVPGVNVGNIKGPLEVHERSEHVYSIDTSGDAGLAFQWSTNLPDLCSFEPPDAAQTTVSFHDVFVDMLIEINVMVISPSYQPTGRKIAVKIVADSSDLTVMGIEGPSHINEYDQGEFTVKVITDQDSSYSWACEPPDAGVFDSPNSPATGFTPGWIYQDTNVIIRVIVGSEGHEPIQRDFGVLIVDYSYGFASYWGPAACYGTDIDSVGDICVTGSYYTSETDLDPGEGVIDPPEDKGAYLSKFNGDGDLIWASTAGTNHKLGYIWGYEIAIDESNNIYQVGKFKAEADFQQGMPSGMRTSYSHDNGTLFNDSMFICKYDQDGDILWLHTWGGIYTWYDYKYNRGRGVAVDGNGDIYVVGSFTGVIDFDPGDDENVLTSNNGSLDAFLCKFDTDGNFKWARSFGGESTLSNAVTVDNQNNAYIRGRFTGFADFDPGPGDTIYGALDNSGTDYISKFNSNGDFVWARAFGRSTYFKDANGLTIDFSGNVISSGQFSGTVDFDPGPGTAIRNQEDGSIYLVRFDRDGNFSDVITFGGETNSTGSAVSIDGNGNVYVSGRTNTGDFKSGDEVCELGPGAYLMKLRSDFVFQWAITTAQGGNAEGKGIMFGPSGDVYVCNESASWTDINPTPIDEWVHLYGSNSLLMKFSEDGTW